MIHKAYGGDENDPELIPGEIADYALEKWRKNGVILACLGEKYVYDPELKILDGNPDTPDITHVIWDEKKDRYIGRGTWRYLTVK